MLIKIGTTEEINDQTGLPASLDLFYDTELDLWSQDPNVVGLCLMTMGKELLNQNNEDFEDRKRMLVQEYPLDFEAVLKVTYVYGIPITANNFETFDNQVFDVYQQSSIN